MTKHEFKYTPYGLRADKDGNLSIGELPQREWVGLTDEEIKGYYNACASYQEEDMVFSGWVTFARAIETVLKEKNT